MSSSLSATRTVSPGSSMVLNQHYILFCSPRSTSLIILINFNTQLSSYGYKKKKKSEGNAILRAGKRDESVRSKKIPAASHGYVVPFHSPGTTVLSFLALSIHEKPVLGRFRAFSIRPASRLCREPHVQGAGTMQGDRCSRLWAAQLTASQMKALAHEWPVLVCKPKKNRAKHCLLLGLRRMMWDQQKETGLWLEHVMLGAYLG